MALFVLLIAKRRLRIYLQDHPRPPGISFSLRCSPTPRTSRSVYFTRTQYSGERGRRRSKQVRYHHDSAREVPSRARRRRSPFPSVRRPRFTHRAARLPLEPPRSVLGAAPWTLSHLTRTRPAARAPRCCYTGFSALARLANQQRVCGPPTVIVA